MAAAVTLIAAGLLAYQFDGIDLGAVFTHADPVGVGVAAVLSLLPLLGAAGGLLVVSPARLPLPATLAVQVATSFTNLLTPAGAGGSMLLVRFVHKRCGSLPAALAAVGLTQTASVMSSGAVIAVALFSAGHHVDVTGRFSSASVVICLAGIAAVSVALGWLLRSGSAVSRRVRTGLAETWKQAAQTLRRPGRVAAGVAAGLVVLLGQMLVLNACVAVYDTPLPLLAIALVLSAGTAVGAAAPIPGGIGATEAGLTAGLVVAGVEPATALMAVLLYRLLTFWVRVPVGWGCLIWLRRNDYV